MDLHERQITITRTETCLNLLKLFVNLVYTLASVLCTSNVTPGCNLFISAVGVPPVWAVEKLHAKDILVMNMVGGTLFL